MSTTTTTTPPETNDLRHGFTFLSVENGHKIKTHVKIRLNDECGNGHEDFSVTADVWRQAGNGRWVDYMGGCCHDHILKLRPSFQPFVNLHLCAADGVPTHAMANAFYWFAGFNGGLGQEYHGGSGRDGKPAAECRRIFTQHIRATEPEVDALVAALPRTEQELQAAIEDLGLPARWKAEAAAAIRQLEAWTGKKFKSAATKATWAPLTPEARQLIADRKASGYYSPEQVAQRDEAKRQARKAARIAEIKADHAKQQQQAERELAVKLYLAERYDSKINAIYYTHTNTLAFNWSTLDPLVSQDWFNTFVAGADLSQLPPNIRFEFNASPRH